MAFVFVSCTTTNKDYLSRTDEDAALFDAVKALGKHPNDSSAANALPVLYTHAQQRHLRIVEAYKISKELSRWTQIIDEYGKLQKIHDVIAETEAANRLVNPANFQSTIYDLRQQAAEEYYSEASTLLAASGKAEAKKAYGYFKKAEKWVAGYKDAKEKMEEAYHNATLNVVINEIKDNSYSLNTGWGNYNVDYSNRYFQQTLVRELGGQNANRYPAKFYIEWEANQQNIQPDLIIDLILRNVDMPRPTTSNYSQRSSKEIEVGRDTSGRIIYQTVYATVNIARQSYNVRADMELNITDANTRKNLVYNIYREGYSWQEDEASYTGDSRALGDDYWNLINNSKFNQPGRDDVLKYIYDRIYPQVKSKIAQTVDW
jgi:hypothetical protein